MTRNLLLVWGLLAVLLVVPTEGVWPIWLRAILLATQIAAVVGWIFLEPQDQAGDPMNIQDNVQPSDAFLLVQARAQVVKQARRAARANETVQIQQQQIEKLKATKIVLDQDMIESVINQYMNGRQPEDISILGDH